MTNLVFIITKFILEFVINHLPLLRFYLGELVEVLADLRFWVLLGSLAALAGGITLLILIFRSALQARVS